MSRGAANKRSCTRWRFDSWQSRSGGQALIEAQRPRAGAWGAGGRAPRLFPPFFPCCCCRVLRLVVVMMMVASPATNDDASCRLLISLGVMAACVG